MEARSCEGELNRPDRGYISLTEATSFEMRQNSTKDSTMTGRSLNRSEGCYIVRNKVTLSGRRLHRPEGS